MRVVGLDISTKTGWAFFQEAQLVSFGTIRLDRTIEEFGPYPFCYDDASEVMAGKILAKLVELQPHVIVIEETNLGRFSRYSQKALEFLHKSLLRKLNQSGYPGRIVYINSSTWRKNLKIEMLPEDKKMNSKLSSAKSAAKKSGKSLDKKALGIKGKITKKHLAIRWVNAKFDLNLGMKDNDTADSICLAQSYLNGAPICNGK